MRAWILLFSLLSMSWAHAGEAQDISFSARCDANNITTLSFVGDILIHKDLYLSVVRGTKHFTQIWERTNPLIAKADFSVGNLEGPAALGIDRRQRDNGDVGFIYDDNVYSGTNFVFNFHPRVLSDLKKSGYDLLTNANNHSLDRGSLGIDRTLEAAKDLNFPLVGIRSSWDRNGDFHHIARINDMKIAFVGCTELTNGLPDKKDQVLHCFKNRGQVENIVRELAARSDVDAVIVLPHWGTEYTEQPNRDQKQFARKFLEAGATAVIGSHPHMLQPWEKYVTQDGRETLIIYSLGNFVAYQKDLARKTGAVAYMGLTKNRSSKASITGVAYTTTYRDGVLVYVIGEESSRDILAKAAQNFGTKNRLAPAGNLNTKLCR